VDIQTYDLITDWKERVNELQKTSYSLAIRYRKYHYGFGVFSVVLAAAAVAIFIGEVRDPWWINSARIGGTIAVLSMGFQVFFSFAKRSENCMLTVSQLAAIRRDVELFESFVPERNPEREQRVHEIESRIAEIEAGAQFSLEQGANRKEVWVLQGAALASLLLIGIFLASRYIFNQVPFLTTEQSVEFWLREAVQQGVEDWQFDPDDPLIAKREILINTWINELATKKVVISLAYLNEQDNHAPISVYLTATGGFSKDAYAIVNAIQQSEADVNTIAIGDCFSACAMILMSGTGDRKIIQGSRIAIHTHYYPDSSDAFSYFTVLYERELEFFGKYSGIPLIWIDRKENFYYLSPEQAVEYQIVDKIIVDEPNPEQ
jgi:ATP-dependent protease ClpP protease subunit